MGNLVFQATLGGQVNLVGPNTASTFNINVPAIAGTLVTTGDTGTVTNTMLASSAYTAPGTIGSGTPNTGAFTTLSATGVITGTDTTDASSTTVAAVKTAGGLAVAKKLYVGTGGAVVDGLTVGKGAGAVATNTAVGASALAGNSTGANVTAVGYNALAANTGSFSTAVGYGSIQTNTSGTYHTALGWLALQANTTGTENSAVGAGALYSNTTGSSNVALGRGALLANTTASNNTAVGYQALYSNTISSFHVAIGYQAGYAANNGACVFIGAGAGKASTGSSNTFVGTGSAYGVGELMTTGSKNTIIGGFNGNQGGFDIRTASNNIVLSDGDGNPTLISTGIGSISANHTSAGGNSEFCLMRASVKKWFIWNDGATDRFNITPSSFSSGVYLTNTATAWAAYSDRRIKSNIVDLEYGLATVMAMQPRRYTVTANSENSIGFVAQELKEVLPEAVVGEEIEFSDDDTPQERSAKTMGVAKDNIIPVLVKAIQELKAEFDTYKEAHP